MTATTLATGTDWMAWTEQAMEISGSFEGNGQDWGNPVGNFDGAYLTCGLLGFTWKWNNQPPMIKDFIRQEGESALLALMPNSGNEYLKAVEKGEIGGASIVSGWSVGERVKEPYYSELKRFWSCPAMKKIQTESAYSVMGAFARRKTIEGQQYYGLSSPAFSHFAYWFDQAVLNGTGKTQDFPLAEQISNKQVFDWMANETGYTQKSFDKNRSYWASIIDSVDDVQRKLWILAYLRSDLSREEFDTVTMCRRGSLALGSGWINDSLRKFDFVPKVSNLPDIKPNAAEFLKLAETVSQDLPAERLVKFKLKNHPNGDPRYWAIVDFNQPSTKKRLYLFDTVDKKITQYFVAHGKGSEGATDDGMADVFSNIPGSNCSSLGIYICLDAYDGNHGTSLHIDGLESTNSNALDRAVVLHGADYVSDTFIRETGRIGRSDGCFAVEIGASPILTNELKNGSYLIAWKI